MAKIQLTPIDDRLQNPVSIFLDSDVKEFFYVGRQSGNERPGELDLIINDRSVSRLQARFEWDETPNGIEWYIRDMGSRNGTLVNGIQIAAPRPLNPRDKRAMGEAYRLSGYSDQIKCGLYGCGFLVDAVSTESGLQRQSLLGEAGNESTINKTIQDAIAEHDRQMSASWPSRIGTIILEGPQGIRQWLWWSILIAVAGAYIWFKYGD